MRRHGTAGRKPAKKPQQRKPTIPKRSTAARAACPASSALSDLQEQVSALTRELAEAREQQTATSEVLHAISSSPGDLKPVLAAICETVAKLCETKDAEIFIRDGDRLRLGWVQGPIGTEAENWPITRARHGPSGFDPRADTGGRSKGSRRGIPRRLPKLTVSRAPNDYRRPTDAEGRSCRSAHTATL